MYSSTFGKGWVGRSCLYFLVWVSFGSFSLRELTCMYCVYLVLWTRKVLCGSFFYALYINVHSFIHSLLISARLSTETVPVSLTLPAPSVNLANVRVLRQRSVEAARKHWARTPQVRREKKKVCSQCKRFVLTQSLLSVIREWSNFSWLCGYKRTVAWCNMTCLCGYTLTASWCGNWSRGRIQQNQVLAAERPTRAIWSQPNTDPVDCRSAPGKICGCATCKLELCSSSANHVLTTRITAINGPLPCIHQRLDRS